MSSSSWNQDSWVAKVPWKMLAKLVSHTPNPPVEMRDFVAPELLQKFSNLVFRSGGRTEGNGFVHPATCSVKCME